MKNKIMFAIFAVILLAVTAFAASAQAFTITSNPALTATVGQQYSYQMTTSTTNVTFDKVTSPSGFTVDSDSGLYLWNPASAGTYLVNLSAKSNGVTVYQAFNITANAANVVSTNMLEIDEIQVDVNGHKEDTLSSAGTIDYDAKFDDEITLKITVKNNFKVKNDSTRIRSIDVELSSSDIDAADGLDESISKLEADDDDDVSLTFTLDPEEIDTEDAPFDITVDVEGETTDGTVYTDSWTIKLDMDSKSKDLYIYNVEASPLSFSACTENKIRISADMKNVGSKDLDNAAIRMKISDLGINRIVSDIEIDSGDEDSFSDYVTIPAGVTAGVYTLEIDALPVRTTNTVTSEAGYDVTILACKDGTNDSTGNTNTGNTGSGTGSTNTGNTGTVVVPDTAISGTPVSSAVGKKGLFDSDNALYIALLAVLVILLIIVIALLAVKVRN